MPSLSTYAKQSRTLAQSSTFIFATALTTARNTTLKPTWPQSRSDTRPSSCSSMLPCNAQGDVEGNTCIREGWRNKKARAPERWITLQQQHHHQAPRAHTLGAGQRGPHNFCHHTSQQHQAPRPRTGCGSAWNMPSTSIIWPYACSTGSRQLAPAERAAWSPAAARVRREVRERPKKMRASMGVCVCRDGGEMWLHVGVAVWRQAC